MKVRYILFAVILCLILTACDSYNPAETEPNISTPASDCDAQNKYAIFGAISFQEADNFYCGSTLIGTQLYYYDKETGISGILCADPSCSHDSSSCGAYTKSGATMFLYNGSRYWITSDAGTNGSDYVLWQGDISGANQKRSKPSALKISSCNISHSSTQSIEVIFIF